MLRQTGCDGVTRAAPAPIFQPVRAFLWPATSAEPRSRTAGLLGVLPGPSANWSSPSTCDAKHVDQCHGLRTAGGAAVLLAPPDLAVVLPQAVKGFTVNPMYELRGCAQGSQDLSR